MARDGADPQRVAIFLRSKGVEVVLAEKMAEEVCATAKKNRPWGPRIWRITGWIFVIAGVGLFAATLIAGETIIIPGGFILLGAAMLWAPELLKGDSGGFVE